MDSSTITLWTGSFPFKGVSGLFVLQKNLVFNANSVDPNQTPRFAASDLGLYCLQRSQLRDASLKEL